jgi:hypothetical protein
VKNEKNSLQYYDYLLYDYVLYPADGTYTLRFFEIPIGISAEMIDPVTGKVSSVIKNYCHTNIFNSGVQPLFDVLLYGVNMVFRFQNKDDPINLKDKENLKSNGTIILWINDILLNKIPLFLIPDIVGFQPDMIFKFKWNIPIEKGLCFRPEIWWPLKIQVANPIEIGIIFWGIRR